MEEEEKRTPDLPPDGQEQPPVVYATPMKRIWAWVGVVYMLILTFLMTYLYAKGSYLKGIGGLMSIPALGGLAASAICVWRAGPRKTPGRAAILAVLLLACGALIVLGLVNGIPGLLANFGGRQ